MYRVIVYLLAILAYAINLGSFAYVDLFIDQTELKMFGADGRVMHALYVSFPIALLVREIESEVVYRKGCIAMLIVCLVAIAIYLTRLGSDKALLIHFLVGGIHVGIYFRFYQILRLIEHFHRRKT